MKILAWAVLVLVIIGVVIAPAAIGKERKPYGYSDFIGRILEAAMLIPLALRVLGYL